jgi:hypothetical protein
MGQDLLCQLNIAFGASGADVVGQNRLAETGGFCQANAARDDGLEDVVFEELAQILLHLSREIRSIVVHGQQDALNFYFRPEGFADTV